MKLKPKLKNSVFAEMQDCTIIQGLDCESIAKIKDELTFDNPAYERVKRYSKYSYTNVSPSLFYFKLLSNHRISVPIGFDVSKYTSTIADNRVYEPILDFPEFTLTLRDEQEIAAEAYFNANSGYQLKGSIQLPTGKGKSILALYIAFKYKAKTLIVVHKDDLIKGWKDDIIKAFDGKVQPGLIKAKSREVGEYITLATVQTLNRLSEEELDKLYQTFGLVIQDEMHHCPASTFGIVAKFNARYKLGLTATPERSDGLAHVMNLYFGDFCYRYKKKSTTEEEDILPVEVITKSLPISLIPLCKKVGRSYEISDLSYSGSRPVPDGCRLITDIPYATRPRVQFQSLDDIVVRIIVQNVCSDILSEYNKGRSCIVFFTQKEHCRVYRDYLESLGVKSDDIGLYYGDNPDNEAVREKAESQRKFITLTTYAKATEGTNVKQWEVEFLVSSLNNGKNVEQAVGRIRRVKSGKISTAIVYDYRTPGVYTFSSHGATRDQRYSELGFKCANSNRTLFSRGYNRFS